MKEEFIAKAEAEAEVKRAKDELAKDPTDIINDRKRHQEDSVRNEAFIASRTKKRQEEVAYRTSIVEALS